MLHDIWINVVAESHQLVRRQSAGRDHKVKRGGEEVWTFELCKTCVCQVNRLLGVKPDSVKYEDTRNITMSMF